MPHSRANLERQLEHAKAELSTWAKVLKERGVAAEDRQRDPKWRSLNSRHATLTNRLKAAQAVSDLDEELKQRRADKANAQTEEKPKKSRSKPKKVKSAAEKQPAGEAKSKKKTDKGKSDGKKKK